MKPLNKFLIISLFSALCLSSCADENGVDSDPIEEDLVRVRADVLGNASSRAYQADGVVEDGIYNLTYMLSNNNNYGVASVNFNVAGGTPGMGIVTVPVNQSLKWINVGGGGSPTFYLDNLDQSLYPLTNTSTTVTLGSENPYKAAVFDSISGKNDLLWGEKMVSRNAKTVDFDLSHNMARFRVMVTADKEYAADGQLDLEGATVIITSLNQTPVSFNRLDGTLELNEDAASYTDLTLVDENTDWRVSVKNPDDDYLTTFITPDYVIAPQGLQTNEERPKLVIKLKNGREFSGILPHAMLIDNGDGSGLNYPVALYFLAGHILTIRTVISEEPPSLAIMPVYVTQWVDKGEFSSEAHQSGIYTADEFYKMIKYYNNKNEYQLPRYGKLDGEDVWQFDIWHSISLDYNDIYGMMVPGDGKKNYYFEYNNYSVEVTKDGEPRSLSAAELKNLLMGNYTWN